MADLIARRHGLITLFKEEFHNRESAVGEAGFQMPVGGCTGLF